MQKVIGQTGRGGLSDETLRYERELNRTLRYRYEKMDIGWIAVVTGPFHSMKYGVCGYGTSRKYAKLALSYRLSNDHGYIGNLLFSDHDAAENVGIVNPRLISDRQAATPIIVAD